MKRMLLTAISSAVLLAGCADSSRGTVRVYSEKKIKKFGFKVFLRFDLRVFSERRVII